MEKLTWKPISTLPDLFRDGRDVIVGFDIAGTWIVRSAHWDDGSLWDMQGAESEEAARGWYSYRHSVTQDELNGIYEPTHWLCEEPVPPQK